MSNSGRYQPSRSGDDFERIIPIDIGPAAHSAPLPVVGRSHGFPAGLVWAVLAVALVLAVLLFWLLRSQPQPSSERLRPDAEQMNTAAQGVPITTALVAERSAGPVPAVSVATPEAEAASDAEIGTDANDDQASAQQRVQEQALLAQALSAGRAALAAGDAEAASRAYAQALRIDSNNSEARAGQHRAANLDALRALLNRASVAEASGESAAAQDAYRQALDLDKQSSQARDGLGRVQLALAGDAFRGQMSRGLAALDRGDFGAAEHAFEAALRQRPGAVEAKDGLARVRVGRDQQTITGQRQRVEAAEQAEQWPQARDAYAAVLAVDGTLAFARAGLERVALRADLDLRLRSHIEHPERLGDDQVRADAAGALAAARQVQMPGPRLQAQIERLDALVALASTPVPVTLRSDGQTQVIIYRVGDLGRFESRQQALLPGSYTAVGRRSGYRDVRVNFIVSARGVDQEWMIRCEEPI